MAERGIEERVSGLEAEVEGLANTVTLGEQYQRELLQAELRVFTAQMEKVEEKIDSLRSRKGETHADFTRRIEKLEGHIEEHCDELEEVRSAVAGVGTDVSTLLERADSWKSYLIPVAVAVTMLLVGFGANLVVELIRGGSGG